VFPFGGVYSFEIGVSPIENQQFASLLNSISFTESTERVTTSN